MRVLVDTNILVRSIEHGNPLLSKTRQAMKRLAENGDELCVTPQVMAEFWGVCTRSVASGGLDLSVEATESGAVRIESAFTLLPDSIEAYRSWRRLVFTQV